MKFDITKLAKNALSMVQSNKLLSFVKENASPILTGAGVGLMGVGAYLIHLETRVADAKLQERIEKYPDEPLTTGDKIMYLAPIYGPGVAAFLSGGACVFFSDSLQAKAISGLLGALATNSEQFELFKQSTYANVDEDTAKKIKTEAIQEEIKSVIGSDEHLHKGIVHTGNGNVLFKERMTGMEFYSSELAVRSAVNILNERLFSEYFVSLNEWLTELRLPTCGVGELVGWSANNGMVTLHLDAFITEEGEPGIYLDYLHGSEPRNDFLYGR